jgi:hypothetical protein
VDWKRWTDCVAARSPDLNTCDYYLWGYMKTKEELL